MKDFLLYTFCLLNLITLAQVEDCSSAKIGKFELISKTSGRTVIQRTDNVQIETYDSQNIEAAYDIIWINSCNYELKNRKIIRGKINSPWNNDYRITVEIYKIDGDKIFIRSSSNYNEKIVERILTKLE